MKKFAIILLIFIAVLAVILFLKVNGIIPNKADTQNHLDIASQSSSTYSDEEIRALILKGKNNLNNMENVYYEWGLKEPFTKIYYKGNKMKRDIFYASSPNEKGHTFMILAGKEYSIDHKGKNIHVSNSSGIDYGFQTVLVNALKSTGSYKSEFVYLRDEVLDNKDCILVKDINRVQFFSKTTDLYVYWIEKSTGFMIGDGEIQANEDTPKLRALNKNISIGTVQDSDFEIPTGYNINY